MRLRRYCFLFIVFIMAIPLVSCRSGHEVDEPPQLVSVTVDEAAVVLSKGGMAELHFSVKDVLFRFSGAPDLVLSPTSSGHDGLFGIAELRQDVQEGHYVAVVKDFGGAEEYSVETRLGVRVKPGSDALVLSDPFEVRNTGTSPSGLDTGLPVVYLNTEGGARIKSKVDWVPATLRIEGEQHACSVRGRGNTTWEWPKKPYAIKLESKASLFGMPAHKRWVLLANFMDRTLMRNIVAMKVASLTSLDWTPSCVSVELVLNGEHQGNYLLIEQVRVDKDRVNVDKNEGILLELDFHYDNEVQWIEPLGRCVQRSDGIPFGIKYPDAEDLGADRFREIKNYVSEVSAAIYGPSSADPEVGYAKYLDVDSFIDYWIVFEVMGNHELGNPGSVFMHRDKGGKLTAGPCWDFDWGVLSYKTSPAARTGLINSRAIWYAKLFTDPAFRAKVKARFNELLPALKTIPEFMEDTEEKLARSAKLNFAMWNPAGDATMNGGSIVNGDENITFHEASERLRSIFEERLEVIRKCL